MKLTPRKNLRVLVTGGPTRAYLDGVRFLSNISTGSLAFEICRCLKTQAQTSAVVGPTVQRFAEIGLRHLREVETSDQMLKEVLDLCRHWEPHAVIFCAAVLDFAPLRRKQGKTPSTIKNWAVTLKPTPKIIDEVGRRYPAIARVGFKLETKKMSPRRAKTLLAKRGLAFLVVNYIQRIGPANHQADIYHARKHTSIRLIGKKRIARWLALAVVASVQASEHRP